MQREHAANQRYDIDLVARPSGDAQDLVNGEPGYVVAPALFPA